jgi:hypothetical protein
MSRRPEFKKLIARRTSIQGESSGSPYEVTDMLSRGDDLLLVVELPKGGVPSEAVAAGICAMGLRANASKQEASDVPGTPVAGFANVVVTEEYMGKLAGRTVQRYMVQESPGLDKASLDVMREEIGDLEIELGIMTTTATAKSRLAPLAGFPLLDQHPIADFAVKLGVHNDKYRLAYLKANSLDSKGLVTDEGKALLARAKMVEARAMARLRARRENVSIDLDRLMEVYEGSTVHELIEEHALQEDYKPTEKMEEVDNLKSFLDDVRNH